jgi:predicted ATP-grasp superfamily ATP-dependent carboligase
VLITGGLERKTLAAAACLSEFGHEVHVGDSSRLAPGLWSRYCRRRIVYPSSRATPGAHLAFLADLLRRERYDLVLPCSEYEVHLYSEHRDSLERFTRVALPRPATLRYAMDKAETAAAARAAGVPHPHTWAPRSAEEVDAALREIGDAVVVVKPRTASGSRGLSIVRQRSRLRDVYWSTHARYPWPVIQEYIPSTEGGNVTMLVLGRAQELLGRFSYVRLREFPVGAGASTLVESVKRPDQEEYAEQLLRAIGWTGIAMVEFRRDRRDGLPKVIEINERLNSSARLAWLAGVPFPQILYELYVQGSATPVLDYRTGIRCRWLIPGDILHFVANPERWRLQPSFFAFRDPDTHHEFLDRRDPKPLVFWILWMLSRAWHPGTWTDFVFRRWSRRK